MATTQHSQRKAHIEEDTLDGGSPSQHDHDSITGNSDDDAIEDKVISEENSEDANSHDDGDDDEDGDGEEDTSALAEDKDAEEVSEDEADGNESVQEDDAENEGDVEQHEEDGHEGGGDEQEINDDDSGDESHADEEDDADDDLAEENNEEDDNNQDEEEDDEQGSVDRNNSESEAGDDDDDDDNDEDDDDEEEQTIEQLASNKTTDSHDTTIKLGGNNGTNGTPAYALITGKIYDEDRIITIPITRLPVILGKESYISDSDDLCIIGLNHSSKQIAHVAKQQCCIFYRDECGGKLGLYSPDDEGANYRFEDDSKLNGMRYIKPKRSSANDEYDKSAKTVLLRLPGMKSKEKLPKGGFFAIQCLSPHKIRVGGKWVSKGQIAMLADGITIQISSYCFYFLLPKLTPSHVTKVYPKSLKQMATKPSMKKEKTGASQKRKRKEKDKQPMEVTSSEKLPDEERPKNLDNHSITEEQQPPEADSSRPPSAKKPRKSDENFALKLEKLPTEKLLELLSEAAESADWDRNDQLVGSALAIRAVRAAASSAEIQKIALTEMGVSQRQILDWLNGSKLFRNYEKIMLSKIERKSFLTSVGKAILRAGFTRNESTTNKRAHRWDLPQDIDIVYDPDATSASSPPDTSGDIDQENDTAEVNDDEVESGLEDDVD